MSPEIEVVIVDDKSSDNTLEVARRLEQDDGRVRVLANEENAGPGATRNRALEAARGEWVALLDADDIWLPGRLERLAAQFEGADAVSDDVVIEEAGKRSRTLLASHGFRVDEPVFLRPADLARHGLGLLQPVVRRSFLDEHGIRFEPTLRIGEDFLFLVHLLLAGARWRQLGEAHYVYRRSPHSITSGRREHIRGRLASDTALLRIPAVRADPELHKLLEERVAWLRDLDRLHEARERGAAGLVRSLVAHPRLAVTAARHGYHLARRRMRSR